MPIDDERRRFSRTKAVTDTKPNIAVATGGRLGPKEEAHETLQRLQEMLQSQRRERAEVQVEEEKRMEANKQAAQRGRVNRNEKYERLQQAFERMNEWKEEQSGEGREEPERTHDQGTSSSLSYMTLRQENSLL